MFKIHVISDLDYGFNEPTDPEDTVLPDEADLVIFNGNIGRVKRGFLYAYYLCEKYPDKQFVYNFGEIERYYKNLPKFPNDAEESMALRVASSHDWPKNLHWKDPRNSDGLIITLRTGQTISVFSVYGFPRLHSYEGKWEDTNWYRNYATDVKMKEEISHWEVKPAEYYHASYGQIPIWATFEWVNQEFYDMEKRVREWELNLKHYGVFVTHLNPYNDTRLANMTTSPYRIHLNNLVWITSNTEVDNINYLGAKLYSNPGRGKLARSKCITVDGSNN